MAFVIATAILLFVVTFVGYNAFASQKWHQKNAGQEYKKEAEHYYWYFVYYNPDDPRLFKPRGGGYTLNFARPTAVISTAVLLGGYLLALYVMYN